ncbi:MAG TPA: hypothetical protein VFU19_13655 [Iamia sp.]|nr:hypothetical protein [Iamia sp.]
MTADHDLDAGLRRVAAALDRAVTPIDPAAVLDRRPPAGAPRGQALLAVAAALALVAAVVAALASGGDDRSVQTERPPVSVVGETTTTAPTTTAPPETGPPGTGPVRPASYEGVPWEQLPERGEAVVEGERVTLRDLAGTELGSFPVDELPQLGSVEEPRLRIQPGVGITVASAVVEEGDCLVTTADGNRVAACGPEQGTLALLRPDGTTVDLAGMAIDARIGRWRRGFLSPDGRWVLGQWSAECETPFAMLVPTDGGPMRTADGFTTFDGSEPPFPATSWVQGWTADGRAVVTFPDQPACGQGDPQPGTYAIDPETGARTPVDAEPFRLIPWARSSHENDRELALSRATVELGLEPCCGEPAHGGGGVTGGVVWEGTEVPILGGDVGPIQSPLTDVAATEVDGLPVTTGVLEGNAVLAFTCGDTRWFLGGAVVAGAPPGPEQLAAVASALIPHLYCTVGPPPAVAG